MKTVSMLLAAGAVASLAIGDGLKPYSGNPRYWEYNGKPVLFCGGSNDDNLFQWPKEQLIPHLDAIVAAGGNLIRNTMSDRDEGNVRAFAEVEPGKYDLAKWNPEYWNRFDTMLRETSKRGIIVQIEIWDRFDHSRDQWKTDPYNPANNVNYTYEQSGFAPEYPNHPLKNEQPFFFTVPALDDNAVVRPFQEAFVQKLLQHTLPYGNVLYCMDNETSADPAWGAYWAEFIRNEATAAGKSVFLTEMWDEWDVTKDIHRETTDHPERYDFIDISQNSQLTGQTNWENAQVVWQRISAQPRPINSTKIYGNNDYTRAFEAGKGNQHAVDCFWRNLVGGFATSRFHRPVGGLGLGDIAARQIRAVREWQKHYDVFRSIPDSGFALLEDRAENEAYACSIPGEAWTVFFTHGGSVSLKIGNNEPLILRWCNLETGAWSNPETVTPERGYLLLEPKNDGMALAVVKKKDLMTSTNFYAFSYFTQEGETGLHLTLSTDGFNWQAVNGGKGLFKAEVAGENLMRDPFFMPDPQGNGYHCVWTTGWRGRSIGYAFSDDLIHWKNAKAIPVMEQINGALNAWAPEICYDEANGRFWIYFSAMIPERYDGHRMWCVTTTDFKTFTPAELFFDPGYSVIDAHLIRDNGRFVMIFKDERKGHKCMKLAFADSPKGPWSEPTEPISAELTEGPTSLKLGNKYLILYDNYGAHHYGAFLTSDFKQFQPLDERLNFPGRVRHGTLFSIPQQTYEALLSR